MTVRSRLCVAALSLLVFSSCGDDVGSTTSTTSTITSTSTTSTVPAVTTTVDDVARIMVTVGVDSGADRVENVRLGQQVELTIVNPDDDDEFHLHGYDLGGDETPAGEEKTFSFVASEAGDFEVESHLTEEVLVVLRVS